MKKASIDTKKSSINRYQLPPKDHLKLKSLLSREPHSLEIVLALALWNEHCSYRSSKKHLKKFQFPTKKKISGLGEQAGVVDLGQGERICFKMESHNHPSYIMPYHGSETAIGGILRDIFAMNARPIALADYLCFADSSQEKNTSMQKEHASRVDGVVRGISDYGNCIGIPTVTGYTEFSKKYNGNILVNAMALGYLDSKTKVMSSQAKNVGSYVVYVGSATGRDGILGADMASQSFDKNQKSSALPTIQIGDPFLGKQLMEACLLAMKNNLVEACQDMGAAGLTCSSFEISDKSGLGLSLHLDRVPLRDKSLQPEEILLSESQERMLFICKPSHYKELEKLFRSYQLEISLLGEVLRGPHIHLYWKGKEILKVDPKLFTSHSPEEDRPYVFPKPAQRLSPQLIGKKPSHPKKFLLDCLSSAQGRSRSFIYRQYDQRVGTRTVKDSSYPIAILRLPETGRELALAMGCRPYLMELDVEQGAQDSVFYPALQLAIRGFEPLAITDCLNFGNPEKEEIMGGFVLSVEKIAEACKTLDTPIISGNVSFYNEREQENVTPTPAIVMAGIKSKPEKTPSCGFLQAGEKTYLLHSHQFCFEGAVRQLNPSPALAYGALQSHLVKVFVDQMRALSEKNLFSSVRLVGKFGLAYTLARMVLPDKVGFSLVDSFSLPLYQERLYEVIVSVKKDKEEAFKQAIKKLSVSALFLGESQAKPELKLQGFKLSHEEIKERYFKSWQDLA